MSKFSPLLTWTFVLALIVNAVLVQSAKRKGKKLDHETMSTNAGPEKKYSSAKFSIEGGPDIHIPDGDIHFGEDGEPKDHPYFTLPDVQETPEGPLMVNGDPDRLIMEHLEAEGPYSDDMHIDSPNTSKASSTESQGPKVPKDVKGVGKGGKKERRERLSKQERREKQDEIESRKKQQEGSNKKNGEDVKESQTEKKLSKKQRRRALKELAKEA